MKKIVVFAILFMLSTVPAYAGDVPEGLLFNDNAELFFAEVMEYGEESVELKVTKAIKGDAAVGAVKEYREPSAVGFKETEIGKVYLAAYFDENNPTYLFETTSYDTATLKIKGIGGMAMWARLQKFLNNGDYEQAELDRLHKITADASVIDELTLSAYLGAAREETAKVYLSEAEEQVEIDRDKFFDFAEKTVLTKAEEGKPISMNGIYITAEKNDGSIAYAYISEKGEADRYGLFMSRLPARDYMMKRAAVRELKGFLPDAEGDFPTAYIAWIFIGIIALLAAVVIVRLKLKR